MIIVGIENRKGTFKNEQGTDIAYDNKYIHLVGENENTNGQCTASYKVSKNCEIVGASSFNDLIGMEVLLCKDKTQYGTSVSAIIVRE